ncbi:MAG: hypothetical protein ACI4JC_01285 [Faecalibacterium sp.]
MADTKKYTKAQLENAEELAKVLSSMPEDQQRIIVTMANCFIAGYEARISTEKMATA